MTTAHVRHHAIHRIVFPFGNRYVEQRCCGLETPDHGHIPHDESQGGSGGGQEWKANQGHHQEPGVVRTRLTV